MPLKQDAFTPEKRYFDGTIIDVNEVERTFEDRTTGEPITRKYYEVEVQGLRSSFNPMLRFPTSQKPNGKWMRWLRAFRDVGLKVKGDADIIGKSFKFEIRDVAFGDFSSEMYMPITIYGEEDIAAMKVEAAELSVEEKRALLMAKSFLSDGEKTWNDFLTLVFSDEMIRDDAAVRDILSDPAKVVVLPGVTMNNDLVRYAA
jgi:hypothetical protein